MLMTACFVAPPMIMNQVWHMSDETVQTSSVVPPSERKSKIKQSTSVKAEELTSESIEQETSEPAVTSATEPVTEPPVIEPQFVTKDYSYFSDALFIGDSRTVGLRDFGGTVAEYPDYFCKEGLSTDQVQDVWIDGLSFNYIIDAKQYSKIYIMLGVNECGNDFETILKDYRAIVEILKVHQPNALIFIQANLHVAQFGENQYVTNDKVHQLNDRISELADNKRVFYIDVNEIFDDEYGYLSSDYTSDGVHVYGKYYMDWWNWLCEHAVEVPDISETTENTTETVTTVSQEIQ